MKFKVRHALFKKLKIQFYTCLNHCKSVHHRYKLPSAHPFIKFPNINSFCYLGTDTECTCARDSHVTPPVCNSFPDKPNTADVPGGVPGITNNSDVPIAPSQTTGTNNRHDDAIPCIPVTWQSLGTTPILISTFFFFLTCH